MEARPILTAPVYGVLLSSIFFLMSCKTPGSSSGMKSEEAPEVQLLLVKSYNNGYVPEAEMQQKRCELSATQKRLWAKTGAEITDTKEDLAPIEGRDELMKEACSGNIVTKDVPTDLPTVVWSIQKIRGEEQPEVLYLKALGSLDIENQSEAAAKLVKILDEACGKYPAPDSKE